MEKTEIKFKAIKHIDVWDFIQDCKDLKKDEFAGAVMAFELGKLDVASPQHRILKAIALFNKLWYKNKLTDKGDLKVW